MTTKICSKCKIEKDIKEFHKDKYSKDGLSYQCKECKRKYRIENREYLLEYQKDYNKKVKLKTKSWREKNKEKIKIQSQNWYERNKEKRKQQRIENREKALEYQKEYRKKNKKRVLERDKVANKKRVLYKKYWNKLTIDESPISDKDGFMQVKCTYCNKYFYPITRSIKARISALNGKTKGEARLYCSESCKKSCPIYRKSSVTPGIKSDLNRDMQPQWREMVLERDGYKCIKCGATEDLIAHHKEGIQWNPLESADIDIGVTLCKHCEREAHSKEGCSYYDMQCK